MFGQLTSLFVRDVGTFLPFSYVCNIIQYCVQIKVSGKLCTTCNYIFLNCRPLLSTFSICCDFLIVCSIWCSPDSVPFLRLHLSLSARLVDGAIHAMRYPHALRYPHKSRDQYTTPSTTAMCTIILRRRFRQWTNENHEINFRRPYKTFIIPSLS